MILVTDYTADLFAYTVKQPNPQLLDHQKEQTANRRLAAPASRVPNSSTTCPASHRDFGFSTYGPSHEVKDKDCF